jgi:phage terminase small subunit
MTDEHGSTPRPEDDAARLGLVVVGEAAALHSGDEAALDASEQNIRDTIDEMIDEPLTDRQEEVVERLAAAGGTLTAGLSGALAAQSGRSVDDILEGAARSVVWQQRLSQQRDDAEHDARHQRDAGHQHDRVDEREDRGGQREDAGGQQRERRNDDGRHEA